MNVIFSFVVGLIFGFGLIVGGMANPEKVIAFLDLTGLWDPSLALVMGGAIAVGIGAFTIAKKRTTSFFLKLPMQLPNARSIDRRLVGGSLLFGVGWGMAGICPGPALVLVGAGFQEGGVFVIAMLSGMAVFEILERFKRA